MNACIINSTTISNSCTHYKLKKYLWFVLCVFICKNNHMMPQETDSGLGTTQHNTRRLLGQCQEKYPSVVNAEMMNRHSHSHTVVLKRAEWMSGMNLWASVLPTDVSQFSQFKPEEFELQHVSFSALQLNQTPKCHFSPFNMNWVIHTKSSEGGLCCCLGCDLVSPGITFVGGAVSGSWFLFC